ncbi:hypothetical protein B0J17DRAFT_328306 [Rhizoctonia solani]|nr:hypothetical protein B0J17DRAFT_328306 [Rhizoctonia solani]
MIYWNWTGFITWGSGAPERIPRVSKQGEKNKERRKGIGEVIVDTKHMKTDDLGICSPMGIACCGTKRNAR